MFKAWFTWFIPRIIAGIVGGLLTFSVLSATDLKREVSTDATAWVMPAIFEHQGAITLGCALYDAPIIKPYGEAFPNGAINAYEGYASVQLQEGMFGDLEMRIIADAPRGTTIVNGYKCAISVDWSAFPKGERPWPASPGDLTPTPGGVN